MSANRQEKGCDVCPPTDLDGRAMRSVRPPSKVRARRGHGVVLTQGSQHMKSMIQGVLLAGTLVLGGTALAQQGAPGQGQGRSTATQGGVAEHRGFMVPTDEKAFLERLHYTH